MAEKKSLREQFKELIQEQAFDDQQYARLQETLKQDAASRSGTRSYNSSWKPFLNAAAILLMAFLGWLIYYNIQISAGENPVIQALADEVAINHINLHTPDLKTDSFESVQLHFDRLDFIPIRSVLLAENDSLLKGARYCTLQGRIATQLFFTSGEGKTITNYQAAYDQNVFGKLPVIERDEEPLIVSINSFEIKIWVEKNIVMVKAQSK